MGNWFSWLDLKHAFRLLRKRTLLELTAPLSLATGIAVAVIGVTVLDAVAFSTLPYETRTVTASCGSGARSSDISTLVSRQAIRQLALGSLLGMALGYGVLRLAQSLEHGLSTTGPWELAAAALALAVAGLLAGSRGSVHQIGCTPSGRNTLRSLESCAGAPYLEHTSLSTGSLR